MKRTEMPKHRDTIEEGDDDGPRLRRIHTRRKKKLQQQQQTRQMDSARVRLNNFHGFHGMECGEMSSHSKRSPTNSHSIRIVTKA